MQAPLAIRFAVARYSNRSEQLGLFVSYGKQRTVGKSKEMYEWKQSTCSKI
jgi:hypothetical protein